MLYSILDNPSFYIAIFSSMCFIASEILPFVPSTPSNGIIHSILVCLRSYNKPLNTELTDIATSKNKHTEIELATLHI